MGTKYGRPFPSIRAFGTSMYRYLTYADTKREAQSRANHQRKSDGLARVTREVSPLGHVMYVVWIRTSRKHMRS